MKLRRIHIILATTMFALLLWFSVSMTDQHQIQVTMPVVVRDLPPGKAISSTLPQSVKLTFHDFGWRLAKLTWGSGIEWDIDAGDLPQRNNALTLRTVSDQLGGRLGLQPISMYPESIFVSLDSLAVRKVRAFARYDVAFRDGFGQVGEAMIQPESTIVTGAHGLLQDLQSWPTAYQALSDLHQSVDVTVPLSDSIRSLAFAPDRVRLRINVQQFAEKTFASIPVEVLSVPQNRDVILSTPRLQVVVRGGIQQLAELQREGVRAIVDYRDVLADTSGVIEPHISVASDVRVVRKTPDRIQYVVRKNTK